MSYRLPQNGPYSSPNIIRVIKSRIMIWAGHVARMADRRGEYYALVGRPELKRPFGRPKRRWEDNIKIDLEELGYEGLGWIGPAQDGDKRRALVNSVMNLRVP